MISFPQNKVLKDMIRYAIKIAAVSQSPQSNGSNAVNWASYRLPPFLQKSARLQWEFHDFYSLLFPSILQYAPIDKIE